MKQVKIKTTATVINTDAQTEQHMTSLEIAELTGKQHKNVMQAIRNMEPAWEKVNGLKFQLVEYLDQKGERRPCYQLTKIECLYIATKFNDETGFIVSSLCGSEVFGSELRLFFSLFALTFICPSSCAKIGNNPDIAKHFLSLFLANLF